MNSEHNSALQRDLLRTLANTMPDIIYAKDIKGRFILSNDQHARLTGAASADDMLGKTDFDYHPRELAEQYLADEKRIMESGEPLIDREEPVVDAEGNRRWNSTTKVPLFDEDGKVSGLVGIGRDVTERHHARDIIERTNAALAKSNEELRRAQFQLVQLEKAQSVARLAAGLAHEIKNPLAVLEMGLGLLSSRIPEGGDNEAVDRMSEAVQRASAIVAGVMDFAVEMKLDLGQQELNATIRHAISLVQEELEKNEINVVTELDPSVGEVVFDRKRVAQVLVDLFQNARHAVGKRGTLTVRSRLDTVDGSQVTRDAGNRSAVRLRQGDSVVVVEVEDTGPGIPPEKLSAVFDPFFTTQPTGQGVGMGLTISRKIMELHGGSIGLSNREEGGVQARVCLKTGTGLSNLL